MFHTKVRVSDLLPDRQILDYISSLEKQVYVLRMKGKYKDNNEDT